MWQPHSLIEADVPIRNFFIFVHQLSDHTTSVFPAFRRQIPELCPHDCIVEFFNTGIEVQKRLHGYTQCSSTISGPLLRGELDVDFSDLVYEQVAVEAHTLWIGR